MKIIRSPKIWPPIFIMTFKNSANIFFLHRYFRFDHRVFWSKWKLSEMIFLTTYLFIINLLISTVLSPGASKVDQTHKFRFYTIFFKFDRAVFWSKWKLSEMTLWKTLNFVMNSLEYTVFTPWASEVAKFSHFYSKNRYLVNFSGSQRENGASSRVGHVIQSCCK